MSHNNTKETMHKFEFLNPMEVYDRAIDIGMIMEWAPDAKTLAVSGMKYSGLFPIILYSATLEGLVQTCKVPSAHKGSIWGLSWRPCGNILASVSADDYLKVWARDEVNGTFCEVPEWGFQQRSNGGGGVCWNSDGSMLVSGGLRGSLELWSFSKEDGLRLLSQNAASHRGSITATQWRADGKILTAGFDRALRVWTVTRDNNLHMSKEVLEVHADCINDAKLSPNGKLVATAGRLGNLKIWSFNLKGELKKVSEHNLTLERGIRGLQVGWSLDGTRLASGDNHSLKAWSVSKRGHLELLGEHNQGLFFNVTMSPDGNRVLAHVSRCSVVMWTLVRLPPRSATQKRRSRRKRAKMVRYEPQMKKSPSFGVSGDTQTRKKPLS